MDLETLKAQEAAVLQEIAELPDSPANWARRPFLEREAAELGALILRWEEEDALR